MLGMLDPKKVYGYSWLAGRTVTYTLYRALVQLARAGGVLPIKKLTKHAHSRLAWWRRNGYVGVFKIADEGPAYEMKPAGWKFIEITEAAYTHHDDPDYETPPGPRGGLALERATSYELRRGGLKAATRALRNALKK